MNQQTEVQQYHNIKKEEGKEEKKKKRKKKEKIGEKALAVYDGA